MCCTKQMLFEVVFSPYSFISTTTRLDKAVKWMGTADSITSREYNNKRSVIVQIDIKLIKRKYPNVANSAYDLTNSRNRNHFLKNDTQKKFARAYSEIVFESYIPSEAVSVCYTTKDGYVNLQKAPVSNQVSSTNSELPSLFGPNIPTRTLNPIFFPETEPRNYPGYADVIGFRRPNTIPLSSEINRPREMIGPSLTISEVTYPYRPKIPARTLSPILRPETEPRNNPGYADEIGYGRPNTIPLSSEINRPREMIGLSSTNFETLGSTRPSLRPNRTPEDNHQNTPSLCQIILYCLCCCVVVALLMGTH